MTKQELVNGLTYLGTAYGKEYTKTECELHYDFLGGYNFNTFVTAVKAIIKRSRYTPRVNELIDECERAKFEERNRIVEAMRITGVFQSDEEYNKVEGLIRAGLIPRGYENAFDKAYKQLDRLKLENKKAING